MPRCRARSHAGQLRVLAVAALQRNPSIPDVPTLAESGLPGFELTNVVGVLAPAGTPKPVLDRLNAEIARILKSPETRDFITSRGNDAVEDHSPGLLRRHDQAREPNGSAASSSRSATRNSKPPIRDRTASGIRQGQNKDGGRTMAKRTGATLLVAFGCDGSRSAPHSRRAGLSQQADPVDRTVSARRLDRSRGALPRAATAGGARPDRSSSKTGRAWAAHRLDYVTKAAARRPHAAGREQQRRRRPAPAKNSGLRSDPRSRADRDHVPASRSCWWRTRTFPRATSPS